MTIFIGSCHDAGALPDPDHSTALANWRGCERCEDGLVGDSQCLDSKGISNLVGPGRFCWVSMLAGTPVHPHIKALRAFSAVALLYVSFRTALRLYTLLVMRTSFVRWKHMSGSGSKWVKEDSESSQLSRTTRLRVQAIYLHKH